MIKIDNLTKEYGDFKLDISMEIKEGGVSGIVGRNGTGKSTTLKAILGLIKSDGGNISILGKVPRELSPKDRQNIGVAFSDSGFSSYLTIKDIIKILKNMYENFDEKWFVSQCGKYALPLNKKIKDFSTGMSARLRVLAACSHEAKLLILDEPTAGLDVIARNEILDLLREYLAKDSGRTLLISSHISSDLEGLCDDIYMLNDGRIVVHEETDVILSSYALLKLSEAMYEQIDKKYILRTSKESFGYSCLTDRKDFYLENYPEIVIESGGIDELIIMMSKEA